MFILKFTKKKISEKNYTYLIYLFNNNQLLMHIISLLSLYSGTNCVVFTLIQLLFSKYVYKLTPRDISVRETS
jgi:hypothetical protein